MTSDIANYAYVWYTKDNPLTKVSQEDLDKIHKIIINYSYPCYLGNDSIRELAPDDKKKNNLSRIVIYKRENGRRRAVPCNYNSNTKNFI